MKHYTLRPSGSLTRVYLYRDFVDFRKSYKGLSAIVERELGHDPFSGELYIFTNRHRNKLKALFWEDNGFVLYYKALAEEKFKWPTSDQDTLIITGQQMNWLLDGYDLTQMTPHKKLHYSSVC